MKAFLMHRDRDFDLQRPPPRNEPDLTQDLGLTSLLGAMARGDKFLYEIARTAVFSGPEDPDSVIYRQEVLRDCLAHPAVVRDMYDLAVEAIASEKKVWHSVFDHPDSILHRSIEVLELFIDALRKLRAFAEEQASQFCSEGFTTLFATLAKELDDEYFAIIADHLARLRFRGGVLVSAELGSGNKGKNYVLRKPADTGRSWMGRIADKRRHGYTFAIADRDENGARALGELRDRGVNLVANALAQSTEHILSFFKMLRVELGFYVCCLNLYELLAEKGEPVCLPIPTPSPEPVLTCRGLYDVCLSLGTEPRVVGNDVDCDGKALLMITGANQGGKSTFLRSVGVSQLMMNCGMFVPAEEYRSNLCPRLFTHYKREEDSQMNSGKLDEELKRMSEVIEDIVPGSMVLFNESFAATNEREGSEIARQVVRALLEAKVKVVFVTHLFDLAHGFYAQGLDNAVFMRAEREVDGQRTFKLVQGEPLPTSYGQDLYRRIFRTPAPIYGASQE